MDALLSASALWDISILPPTSKELLQGKNSEFLGIRCNPVFLRGRGRMVRGFSVWENYAETPWNLNLPKNGRRFRQWQGCIHSGLVTKSGKLFPVDCWFQVCWTAMLFQSVTFIFRWLLPFSWPATDHKKHCYSRTILLFCAKGSKVCPKMGMCVVGLVKRLDTFGTSTSTVLKNWNGLVEVSRLGANLTRLVQNVWKCTFRAKQLTTKKLCCHGNWSVRCRVAYVAVTSGVRASCISGRVDWRCSRAVLWLCPLEQQCTFSWSLVFSETASLQSVLPALLPIIDEFLCSRLCQCLLMWNDSSVKGRRHRSPSEHFNTGKRLERARLETIWIRLMPQKGYFVVWTERNTERLAFVLLTLKGKSCFGSVRNLVRGFEALKGEWISPSRIRLFKASAHYSRFSQKFEYLSVCFTFADHKRTNVCQVGNVRIQVLPEIFLICKY